MAVSTCTSEATCVRRSSTAMVTVMHQAVKASARARATAVRTSEPVVRLASIMVPKVS